LKTGRGERDGGRMFYILPREKGERKEGKTKTCSRCKKKNEMNFQIHLGRLTPKGGKKKKHSAVGGGRSTGRGGREKKG